MARITGGFARLRERFAIGLLDIEDVRSAETHDCSRVVTFGLVVASDDDRREDRDTLLALADEAIQLAPRLETRHARRRRTLARDEGDVVPRILVKRRYGPEQRGEVIAVAF
jgi:hypothetical protein